MFFLSIWWCKYPFDIVCKIFLTIFDIVFIYIRLKCLYKTKCITKVITSSYCFKMLNMCLAKRIPQCQTAIRNVDLKVLLNLFILCVKNLDITSLWIWYLYRDANLLIYINIMLHYKFDKKKGYITQNNTKRNAELHVSCRFTLILGYAFCSLLKTLQWL
jgi:hypothetical protein